MTYKTILTVITDSNFQIQIDAAIDFARREKGHLSILCLGVDETQTGYYYAGAMAYVIQESIDKAISTAKALEEKIRARLEAEDITWSVESSVIQAGGLTKMIGMHARFADLVILSQPYSKKVAPAHAEAITEAALFEGSAPVFIIPENGLPENFGKKIIIAWNQSEESMAAIRRALPLLKAAESVEITIIDPPPGGPQCSDPGMGGALAEMLTRHNIHITVAVLARTQTSVSDLIDQRAVEIGASLVVMGAYGHSRFRESILGGATRNMLSKAHVPLFMAH